MNTFQVKIIITVFVFMIIFLSGFWLGKSEKPYNVIVLTIHKLVSVGIIIFIVITCYQFYKVDALNTLELILGLSLILIFLGAIVSGGLLSTDKSIPSFVLVLHRVSSFVSVLLTGMLIFLLKDRL